MKTLLIIPLLIGLPIFLSCSESNDPETFNLTLVNTFNADLDIYLKVGMSTSTFEERGIILALEELVIEDLLIGSDYTLRAVQFGEEAEDYVVEKKFNNSDPTATEFTVTIAF